MLLVAGCRAPGPAGLWASVHSLLRWRAGWAREPAPHPRAWASVRGRLGRWTLPRGGPFRAAPAAGACLVAPAAWLAGSRAGMVGRPGGDCWRSAAAACSRSPCLLRALGACLGPADPEARSQVRCNWPRRLRGGGSIPRGPGVVAYRGLAREAPPSDVPDEDVLTDGPGHDD